MGQGYKYEICCILVILCISFAKGKKKIPSTTLPFIDETCGEQFKENRCLVLACPRRHVIFDLDVTARLYYKDNASYCSGRTANLMADVAHCYWQNSCRIQFPRHRMLLGLFMDDDEPGTCLYKQPNAVAVSRMGCVKEKEISDICRGFGKRKKPVKQGVIRSHAEYPWINVRRNDTDKCSLMIEGMNKIVYVTVKHVDHVDCDVITINGKGVNVSGNFNFSTDVEVAFTKCSHQEAAGSGLQIVLCFKVDKPGKKIGDVCEAISKKKRSISEAGPKTWPCKSAKGRKKKKHACCCSDIKSKTCKQHLKEAKVFEAQLRKIMDEETCNQHNDYPCDCEGKNDNSG